MPAEQGREVEIEHHDGRESNTEGDQRAELGESGQPAEIENEKRPGGGDGRPDDSRRDEAAQFARGQMGSAERFLVQDQTVIDGQSEQDGSEADADDVKSSEEKSAQRQGGAQHQRQQSEYPQQGPPAPVRPPEQRDDDEEGAAHGVGDVMFHAGCDFSDEGRPASVADGDSVAIGR